MNNTKLVDLLKTFNASELLAFRDFVASPYFNKRKDLVKIYSYLKRVAAKGFPEDQLEKTYLGKKVFPKQAFDATLLTHQTSLLLKLAEEFIGIQKLQEDGILPDCYTMQSYVDRRLEKHYLQVKRRAERKLSNQGYRNDHYYYQQFRFFDIAEQQFSVKSIRQFDENLQTSANQLDIFFLSKKLNYLCAMLDREKILSKGYDKTMIEVLKNWLSDKLQHQPSAVRIYYALLLTLTEEDAAPHFQNFVYQLKANNSLFPKKEIKDLYYYAINFCIRMIRSGKKEYAESLIDLYQEAIDSEVLMENGMISPWTFKNMIKLGLNLRRFDWVEGFVPRYSKRLTEKVRQDALHFNLADLFYHKKDYRKALEHLNKVEFTDIHYNLDAKVMLLKIYYETTETEAFLSLISSFRIFLKRNKTISRNVKESYLNFIYFLYQIHKYRYHRKQEIEVNIREAKVLNGRNWLLQQLKI